MRLSSLFTSLFLLLTVASLHAAPKAKRIIHVDAKATTDTTRLQFQSAREALLFAQKFDDGKWTEIRLEPSVYWLDDPDDPEVRTSKGGHAPFGLQLKLNKVRLVGLSQDPQDVVLASNRGQTQGAEGNFTMLGIEGSDIEASYITFGNYCNVDLDYPHDPSLSRPRRADAIVQAQLAICRGDRYQLSHCRFISRLNLCPFVGPDHVTFDDCYFECTDDALCGTGLYRHCRFTFYSSKPFYATSRQGAAFMDCDIHTKVHGTQYLTKVSSPVTLTRCRWTSDDPNLRIEWTPKPHPSHYCCMTDCTLNGAPYELGPTPDLPMPVEPISLSINAQPQIQPGRWTIDSHKPLDTHHYNWGQTYPLNENAPQPAAWAFGEGVDGAEGYFGLIPVVRGARLMYTGRDGEEYRGQQLSLTLHPCKAAGQGFGSATGQYFDVCLKFDPQSLTGYGIRFVRTPQYDHAVEVYLVEYAEGTVSPISEPQRCDLFHVGCHLTLTQQGHTLMAVISNPEYAERDAQGQPVAQQLSATVAHPNTYGGIHLQHTGTLGPSGLVISELRSHYTE